MECRVVVAWDDSTAHWVTRCGAIDSSCITSVVTTTDKEERHSESVLLGRSIPPSGRAGAAGLAAGWDGDCRSDVTGA
jgi:hypothetical protein